MKKSVLLPFCFAFISFLSKATVHVVQVANYQFSPATVSNVIVGDTMRWIWVSGSHTTTDDPAAQSGNSLPAGAATWSAPVNSANTSFDYKVTVAGTYKYWCIPHSPNMAASFTASAESRSTIHLVQVANYQFSTATVPDVIVGDTMRWVWVSGSHTTTDNPATQSGNSLPAGAASWSAPVNSTSTSFDYKVTVAGTYNYWCIPHSPNMAASFTASSLLPIKLAFFSVSRSNGKALISWKTVTEQNTDYFSVRRSLNGSDYTEIAKIQAAGTSYTDRAYTFTDANISNDKYYYYNLATVDKDGRQQFSEIKIFEGAGKITKLILSLSPNPVSSPGHLMMTFNAGKEGKMEVSVITAQGQAIIQTQMQAYPGVNNGHVHLGNLPAGTYTLVCILDGIKETRQIIFK